MLDSFNDIDLFDLEIRSFSSLKSLNKSLNKHVSLKQLISKSIVDSLRIQSFYNYERKHQNDFFIRDNAIENSFEYQTWQVEMKNQLIFINLWYYVENDKLTSSTILIDEISSAFVVSTSKKVIKFRIDNFKTIAIIRNKLECNDRDFLKNEINVIKTWQILKKSFSSCESKMLNDFFIKLWIITLIINQNVIDYARRFKKTLQNIREMTIKMLINDNILILYFHLDLNAEYE
jgi:hypothetical protein